MWAHIVDTLDSPDGCLHLYSGHDWTVSPLLISITRPDDPVLAQWPPFCSNIAFELWSTCREGLHRGSATPNASASKDHHVRVVYNGQAVDLKCSPQGQETCTLTEFKRMVQQYVVRDFEAECRIGQPARGDATAAFKFNKE